ncbi:hypothetical protein J1N35_033124 [Gossypium stocksii]|uniref:Auxin-responsive protein n=1 Tax=Gossypium stocksii TaxID=47602 RepID=A0A9D3ZNW3_9ROSI|nr:hypothetical protein J1N35_033124 [Gossypium stocksii]
MGVRGSKLIGDRVFKRVGFRSLTPKGYVPVCVGIDDDTRRFIVHRKALRDKDFLEMLYKSSEEYGFHYEGVLRIRYEAKDFEEWIMTKTKWKNIIRIT